MPGTVFLLISLGLSICLPWIVRSFKVRAEALRLRATVENRQAEHERISGALYEHLFQGMAGVLLQVHGVASCLPQDDPQRLRLDEALLQADGVMSEGRELVFELCSFRTQDVPFCTVLAELGAAMGSSHSIPFRVDVRGEHRSLLPYPAEEALGVGRQVLWNAFRRAESAAVELRVTYAQDEFVVCVEDAHNGSVENHCSQTSSRRYLNLSAIQERATNIGGNFSVEETGSSGTRVVLRVPARAIYAG
jgi:signal transduction histidine kinase